MKYTFISKFYVRLVIKIGNLHVFHLIKNMVKKMLLTL